MEGLTLALCVRGNSHSCNHICSGCKPKLTLCGCCSELGQPRRQAVLLGSADASLAQECLPDTLATAEGRLPPTLARVKQQLSSVQCMPQPGQTVKQLVAATLIMSGPALGPAAAADAIFELQC